MFQEGSSPALYFKSFRFNLKRLSKYGKSSFICMVTYHVQMTARSLPRLDEDTRIVPILNNLSQGFLAGVPSDWGGSGGETTGDEIKAEMVDELAQKHFPMCMRTLHDNLRQDHHLKHFGRLQYGLFLKVIHSCYVPTCEILFKSRFWGYRSRRPYCFGASHLAKLRMTSSTRSINITFGIHMGWKGNVPIMPRKGE